MPVDTYTSGGCPIEKTPTVRLYHIKGEKIAKIKKQDQQPHSPYEGCSVSTKYIQYLL